MTSADKLHAIYDISSTNVVIRHNYISRASGAPIVIRGGAKGVELSDNVMRRAAATTQDLQVPGMAPYVQLGFYRIPCSGLDPVCPDTSLIAIENNDLRAPFCWDLMRQDGDDSTCTSLVAQEASGTGLRNVQNIPAIDPANFAYTDADSTLPTGAFTIRDAWSGAEHIRMMARVGTDEYDDLVGFGDPGVIVAHADGRGGFHPASLELARFGRNDGLRVDRHPRFVTDVDGDGDGDIVAMGDRDVFYAERVRGGYVYRGIVLNDRFGYADGWNHENPRVIVDLDQGTPGLDIVGFDDDGVKVASWNGTSFAWRGNLLPNAFSYSDSWRSARHVRSVADINSDGYADIIGIGDAGIYVATGHATGFSTPELKLARLGANDGLTIAEHPRVLSDLEGDGDLDVIAFLDRGVYVALWDAALATYVWGGLVSDEFGANSWNTRNHIRWVDDVNMDGYTDIVGFNDSDGLVSFGRPNGFQEAHAFALNGYSANAGYTLADNPRLVGNIDSDSWMEIVAIGPSQTHVLEP